MTTFTLSYPASQTLARMPLGTFVGYSVQTVARLTGVHPDLLAYYCRLGLIDSVREDPWLGLIFQPAALAEVARIEHYRRHLGVRRKALPLVCELWREGQRLSIELDFLRAT